MGSSGNAPPALSYLEVTWREPSMSRPLEAFFDTPWSILILAYGLYELYCRRHAILALFGVGGHAAMKKVEGLSPLPAILKIQYCGG